LIQATDVRDDYFMADKAWMYVVILSVGYMVSQLHQCSPGPTQRSSNQGWYLPLGVRARPRP
jgi:hypothetical protein